MENLVVDQRGIALRDARGAAVGRRDAMPVPARLVWASMSTRYHPSHPPGESCLFGIDYSFVLPPGASIVTGSLQIFVNTFEPPLPSPDWTAGPVTVDGARVYARLTGGLEGVDFQFRWFVTDTDGNTWPRTAFCLCTQTS